MSNPFVDRERVAENQTAYAVLDRFPVAPGHTLVVPKREVESVLMLEDHEIADCWELVRIVSSEMVCDGVNIGINCGGAAGQTVPCAHIHVIPRNWGDVEYPRGGVRGVIPHKQKY